MSSKLTKEPEDGEVMEGIGLEEDEDPEELGEEEEEDEEEEDDMESDEDEAEDSSIKEKIVWLDIEVSQNHFRYHLSGDIAFLS